MAGLESLTFLLALISLGVSIILAIWRLVAVKVTSAETVTGQVSSFSGAARLPGYLTLTATLLSLLFLTISLILRASITGHGPFSNMYEFAVAFAWGIQIVGLLFWWRYRMLIITLIGLIIALGLLIFAGAQPSQAVPLVPALQQSLLLTVHVATAVFAYGAFTIGFSTALIYLFRANPDNLEQKDIERLDEISYRAVIIGFPLMTLVIVLGAFWADIAWGSYWSWDPKETASLVTWLLYASYLHSRIIRGWRGRKSAILLIIGFAAVIFTFFGNYIFNGLHSYS